MRCDLTFNDTGNGFGLTIRDAANSPGQRPRLDVAAVYKDENEFFKL